VTAAAVRAAFPKGNLYVELRAEFGTLYTDQLFADLYPPEGRPVEVAPWRLALVVVMQYMEGLTDRQAADAVRRCIEWKYALSLDVHDPGLAVYLLGADKCNGPLPCRLPPTNEPVSSSQTSVAGPACTRFACA
jgi:Transposase domain (DUF772)